MSIGMHVHPEGWCSARVEGVEPSLPALETGDVTVRYTRLCSCAGKTKNRPAGVSPAGGSSAWSLLLLYLVAALLGCVPLPLQASAMDGCTRVHSRSYRAAWSLTWTALLSFELTTTIPT